MPLSLTVMKTKLSLTLLLSFIFCLLASQVPQGFSYQALAQTSTGAPVANSTIQVKMGILSDTLTPVIIWEELHPTVKTNPNGVFSIVIGTGERQAGSASTFAEINWNTKPLFIKIQIYYQDNWKTMGNATLWSVPYAMVANNLAGSLKKLSVEGEAAELDEALFEVKNKDGQTIFAVYNEGVRIYVDDGAKGIKGGFAVGGFDMTKATKREYLIVTDDSIRMYLDSNNETKGKKGGFAVGGFDMTKGTIQNYLDVSADSVRVYIADTDLKGKKGGFAVGGYDITKGGNEEYLHITRDSTTIATSNQSKRVIIKNPNDSVPLLNIDGGIKMGYDSIASNGIMGYNGSRFITYEKSDTAWKQFVVTGIPEVITDSVYNISRSGVTIAGNVIKDGGSEIVARGVCWSSLPGPTLMNSSQLSGNGKGHFLSDISGLKGSSTYYIRTFATNSKFTNYSEEQTINTSPPQLPSVNTSAVTSITGISASCGGNITDDGADNITARGICWNTTGDPVVTGDHTIDGTGTGVFISSMTSLQVNKTYFVRAYATNSVGTVYGESFSFATTNLPVLSTNPVTAVTGTSATTGGNIFAGGELSITSRGVCWNTTGNPTLEDSHTENGTGTGSFTSIITGLSMGITYFVRAYAVNSSGTAYGNEYFFTTLNVPTITTDNVSLISGISATCGGNIIYNGGAVVTARGICWNTSGNPVFTDSRVDAGTGTGMFSAEMTGLTIGTTYYIRAYAINSIGTTYGSPKSFTTQNYASVTTGAVTNITYTTAVGGGNITSDGGALITQRGVCWNTTGNPDTIGYHTNDGSGAGVFNSYITGLTANNIYYVRAYTVNSIGITYGQEVNFSTPTIIQPEPGLPVVGTINITTTSTVYNTGGYILSDGGTEVIQRGVCWSTSENPTTADDHTTDGAGTGLFTSAISTLSGCGTTFYVRAYATNSLGTGYGNQLSLSSGLLPFIESTSDISEITKISAKSGGTITSDGGCTITERGVCWNNFQNPTINNFKAVSGSGTGSFTALLNGLYPNYTYYVRAYAINAKGTEYGPELSFKTLAGSSGVAIGQFYAGGLIFYLDESGDHGMVCTLSELGTPFWGCQGVYMGTLMNVGSGAANTAVILANCSEEGIAARLCDTLQMNGYTDWFLPSIDELGLMYNNLHLASLGNFLNANYWSSSENSPDFGYFYQFGAGSSHYYNKNWYRYDIRAARAF